MRLIEIKYFNRLTALSQIYFGYKYELNNSVNQAFSKWVTGHPGVPWRQSRGDVTYFDNIWNLYAHIY